MVAVEEGQELKTSRGRGRPRRSSFPVKEADSSNREAFGPRDSASQGQSEEADNLEWVQCEKCDKWRKLPPHVSADDLPDVWYCSMNGWNPSSASCDAPEDKAEGLQDIGIFGSSGSSGAGKLSYRNLIFGSNGRKGNRPISEKTRAAESLFAVPSDDSDAPSVVMYANSSAFVPRSKANFSGDENESMSVLELMSHSNLWAELRGIAQPLVAHDGIAGSVGAFGKQQRVPFCSFDTLPSDMQESVKDLILHSLGTKTLSGEDILLEAQRRDWDNVPQGWSAIRAYCSINVVVMALCELVKEGVLECVQKMGPDWTVKDWDPRYRRAKSSFSVCSLPPQTVQEASPAAFPVSRCMKIAKPWKRARIQ
jgi:CW-type Zinc Finger